jgi:hypothetical protein
MNGLARIFILSSLLSSVTLNVADAVNFTGDMVYNTDNSDSSGFSGRPVSAGAPTGNNISVVVGGSLLVTAPSGGEIWVKDTFSIAKDFLHNGSPVSLSDPTFYGQGSFSFTGDNAFVTAQKLQVDGSFYNGDGASAWNLALDVNVIEVNGAFDAASGSKLVVGPGDYSSGPSLTAKDISIGGGLYMGDLAASGDSFVISSDSNGNVYTISATGTLDIDGGVNAAKGKLVINGGAVGIADDVSGEADFDADSLSIGGNVSGKVNFDVDNAVDIAGDVSGNVDFDVGGLNIGGAVLDPDTLKDWKIRLANIGTGDLLADGALKSADDILIGGSVNGALDIHGDKDMWIGRDLLGYLSVDVKNLYVLGQINGSGKIAADTVNVGGNLVGGSGGLSIDAGSVNVGGDLSGDLNINADHIHVDKDVLGRTKFRPNLPGGLIAGDAETQFHENPNGPALNPITNKYDLFKQTEISISGTYHFDDNSYLQLVLNSTAAASDGAAAYDPDADDALIKVGGFDASGVSAPPNFNDMDSAPNIEILVDNLDQMISKIRLIEVAGGGPLDMGGLNFAGIWFYWDSNDDGVVDLRLFQESKLVAENNNIYAMVAMMDSIQRLTRMSPIAGGNDIQMAAAIDDLVMHRLRGYSGYTTDDLSKYYTSVMRIMFPSADVYYDLLLNGGAARDAVDVMVSQSPSAALGFVRGIGLGSVAEIGGKLELSGRVSRNAVSDQLAEDFAWTRYYDKHLGWLRMGIGGDVLSFNFGADAKIKKFVAGFNFGYNRLDFGDLDGSTVNFGLYGTYDMNGWARLYANANLAFHSARAKTENLIVGRMTSGFSAADTTLDMGVLHKIFDQYVTGRGYLTLGYAGGYEFTQQYKGMDFMDVSAAGRMLLAPGYEIILGKDIWFDVGGFVRPSVRAGIEYDLIGGGNRDLRFKFSETGVWRDWQADDGDSLWLRLGGQIDFSFIVGTNFSIGYEVLKNGDFKANRFKLNGTYRF